MLEIKRDLKCIGHTSIGIEYVSPSTVKAVVEIFPNLGPKSLSELKAEVFDDGGIMLTIKDESGTASLPLENVASLEEMVVLIKKHSPHTPVHPSPSSEPINTPTEDLP